MDDIAYGKLGDLAGLGARYVGDRDNLRRHVARTAARADLQADALLQILVERDACSEAHEQHDAHVVVEILADAKRLGDFRHLLDLIVYLGRAYAHAAGIERRVGAAMDDHAAMRGPFGEIAVAPDVVEALE